MATINIKTAHGYVSLQPNGQIEFRNEAGAWETFTIGGLTAGGGDASADEADRLASAVRVPSGDRNGERWRRRHGEQRRD